MRNGEVANELGWWEREFVVVSLVREFHCLITESWTILLGRFISLRLFLSAMEKEIKYPTVDGIIEYNILALTLIKVKKADQPAVLSSGRLNLIIKNCKEQEGDLYDKAVRLLKGIIQLHPFASGNRRTAFVVSKEFLKENGGKFNIKDDPKQAKVMLGIREKYYTDEEIKEWIKHGKIKEFKRFER